MPQTPFLFAGTVADNIRYGKPDATDEEVIAAAAAVGGGDWLDALPQGLATDVGEEGRGISMGQRQLVALARVLLQDPAIFILDEATASVDPLTEAQIQEGLDVVLENRTAIVIAHRLSTIKAADRIIVLTPGADHRGGQPRRADGARRALRRAVQHLLPPPVAGLSSGTCGLASYARHRVLLSGTAVADDLWSLQRAAEKLGVFGSTYSDLVSPSIIAGSGAPMML